MLARGGDVNPPPGPVGPTMTALSDIHTLLDDVHAAVTAGASCPAQLPDDPLFAGVDLSGPMPKAFLNLDGIPGESTDPGHAAWVDLLSVGQMLDSPGGGGPVFGPIRVLARMDRSLPPLLDKAAAHGAISPVNVELAQPATGAVFLKIKLTSALVTTITPVYQLGACIVEFDYAKIQVTYTPLDANGNPIGPDVEFCWDVQNGVTC
jgi:type VI secretion system secreted protein Hcp